MFQVALRVVGGTNMISGVLIFFLFICKRKVWTSTKKRHPKLLRFVFAPVNALLKLAGIREIDLALPAMPLEVKIYFIWN
jgi:hypothetical protein